MNGVVTLVLCKISIWDGSECGGHAVTALPEFHNSRIDGVLLACQFQNFMLNQEGGQPISERLRRRTRRLKPAKNMAFSRFFCRLLPTRPLGDRSATLKMPT